MGFLIYSEALIPHYQEETRALYRYSNRANIEHLVSFLPNKLYDNATPANGIYITNFVDRINTAFQYQFVGEREADIKGSYKVFAEVEAYTGEKENYKTIWKKLFPIITETSFEKNASELSINEDIPLNLTSYDNFASEITEISRVNSQLKLTVIMDVNLQAITNHGLIEEKVSPSIVIPLNTNYFEIAKNIPADKETAIEETKEVKAPINKTMVTIYSVTLGLMIVALFCLIYLTVGTEKDEFTKTLNKIFKKHGSRLVALNTNLNETIDQYIKVREIEDLVRVADEIGKPIMYKYSVIPQEITMFYVSEENSVYLFNLKDYIESLEKERALREKKKINKQEAKGKGDNLPS